MLSSHEAEIFFAQFVVASTSYNTIVESFRLLESLDNGHVESKGTQTLAE